MKKQLLLLVTMLLAVVMSMKLWAADGNPEPYAILSQDSTVLTFFYDEQKDARGGLSVGPFVAYDDPSWYGARGSITTVVFDDSFANCTTLTSTARWFAECSKLTTIINISNLKTDNVTSIFHMFAGCSSLTSLDVSGFNTDNVTAMNGMFLDCSSLTTLDVANFNTANVTAINAMFSGCSSLTSINVSGFNTSNVTEMGSMFSGCSSLTSLDVRGFNTDKVTSMSGMFNDCSSLTNLDVNNFNTSKVTTMNFMFNGCSGLTNLDVTNFKTDNVYEMNYMFMGCSGLTSLDISGFKTDNVYDMRSMFRDCSGLTSIYAGDGWSTANVTEGGSMFYNCTNLVGGSGTRYSADHSSYTYAHIDGGTSNPGYFTEKNASSTAEPYAVLSENNTKLTFFYDDQKEIRGGLSVGPFNYSFERWGGHAVNIKIVEFDQSFANCTSITSTDYWFHECMNMVSISGLQYLKTDNVTSMCEMFRGCHSLTSLDVSHFNTENVTNMDAMFFDCSSLTSLDVSGFNTANVTNMRYMFWGCSGLISLDVSHFNTANVTDLSWMFASCSSLTSLDVSHFNTANVTNMERMFVSCSSLTSLDVSHFNTANVTNMGGMFASCSSLTSLDVSGFNTANVTSMESMFSGCSGLTNLDVSNFNTANVTDMKYMFYGCSGLASLDVSGFKTDNVTKMGNMFARCSGLTSIDVSGFNTENVTTMYGMFAGCSGLTSLDVSGFKTDNVTNMGFMFDECSSLLTLDVSHFITVNVTDMGNMFSHCSSLTSLDLSNFNTDNVTDMNGMFSYCSGLTNFDVSNFNTDNVTDMSSMFFSCSGLTSLDFHNFKTDKVKDMHYMFYGCSGLTSLAVSNFMTDNVKDMHSMFDNCSSLSTLDVSGFNTANVTDMSSMFRRCSGLISLNLSDFNTENVKDMSWMFYGCSSLTSLDVSGFNTKIVTNMSEMFRGCSGLISLNLSDFNTENVKDMSYMFAGCSGLTSLDVSGFNTANVTNMRSMFGDSFGGCSSLTSLDLSNFDTSDVTDMGNMFHDCSNLMVLDLSCFNTAKVTSMSGMFGSCSGLATIYVGDGWNTESLASGDAMFSGCIYLIGGSGTHYDENHKDYTYAHIDGGADNPGYFTRSGETPYVAVDPYAVLSENNTVLTFYYDTKRAERKGMSVGPFTTDYYHSQSWYRYSDNITTVEFNPSFADCSNITSTAYWFNGCSNLTAISGIEYLKTDNVTDMSSMFTGCYSLTSLDVSGFNTENVTNMSEMFRYCWSLKTIYAGSAWITNAVTEGNEMFTSCTSLEGGAGTPYDENHVDYTYAHIDGGTSNPGYFTDKNAPVPTLPYAVLSENNTKLTFFYDDQKSVRGGMSVAKGFDDLYYQPWFSEVESITTAEFDPSFANCTTLTSTAYWFYGCMNMVSISGIEYLNTENVTNMDCMFAVCSSLTSLDVSHFNTANVTSMYGMFADCSKLINLDLSHFNTANVTSMSWMFNGCSGLKTIYVGSGWTTNAVRDGSNNMFSNCTSLVGGAGTIYDANHTDHTYAHIDGGASNPGYFTANNERVINGKFVTTDYSSFAYALEDNGTVIEITDNDIVDDSEEPGNRCIKIVSKDNATENWDSHFIIRIGEPLKEGQTYKFSMRAKASRNVSISSQARTAPDQYLHYRMLGNFDLTTGWQTYNVEGVVESEQAGCTVIALLLNVDKSSAEYYFDDISFRVNEAPSASPEPYAVLSENDTKLTFFYDTDKDARGGMSVGPFTETYDSGRERWKTDSGWDEKRENITTVVFDDSFANCTTLTSTAYWFYYCNNLTAISGISSLKTDNVTNMNSMFAGCSSLTSIDVTGFNTDKVTDMCNMFGICSSLTVLDVSRFNTSNVTDMSAMFYNCFSLTNLDVANFNTSKVTNMSYMFRSCSGLTGLDLTNFNTANVTEMSGMFYNCSGLTTLDVSGLNTANVTNMHSMFDSCSRLASLNVSSFNTANVTDMGLMFSACYELTSLDVSGFNTDNVTDMHGMFGGSSGLTSLDLSNFKTDKVTTMFLMFEGCLGLTSLDLSSFNTENVTKFTNMFKECSNLKTIYVGSGWSTANVAEGTSMFFGCTNLVGGAGTAYDENHVDHTYAHIDGGTSNPGYFTAKNAPEGEATFDGKVARVSGERTLDEAFEQRGGRTEATRTIAAIIWNKESALTESDLQGITNPNLLVYVNEARLAPSNVQNVVINGLAREIVLADVTEGNNDWYAPQAFVAERISYTRNFTQSTTKGTSRGWESIALPFDVQTIQHESKGVIAPFNNSASNKHFWLRRLTDNGLQAATNIEANTPYIISMPNSEEYTSDYNLNGRVTFSAHNIDVPATTTKVLALADSSIVMVPAMQRQSRSSSVWALNVGEVRGQYFEGSVFERDYRTVRPFEAYTIHRQENGQPAPRYVPIQEIAGVTGIETIDREPLTLNQWYDMQGRKLEGKPARKGVYISNGKKVVVK